MMRPKPKPAKYFIERPNAVIFNEGYLFRTHCSPHCQSGHAREVLVMRDMMRVS